MNVRPNPLVPPQGAYSNEPVAQSGPYPLGRGSMPSIQGMRPPVPVAAPAAAAPPKAPSLPRRFVRPLVILGIGLLAYGAHLVHERRMPYEWSGTVESRTVKVGSRAGGRVKDVLVREGQTVKAGQVLVSLEAHDLLAQKAVLEADVALAEATLLKLQHGARQQEIAEARARVSQQNAAVAQAEVKAKHEESELRRTKAMVEKGAISTQELDLHEALTRAAHGDVEQARARVSEARASLALLVGGTREEDLKAGEAQVAAARARLQALDVAITELEVRAPRDARIETVNVRPGDLLTMNAPAATLLESGETYVRVYVPETLVGKLAIGQEVPISVDSYPGRTFKGKVEHVNAMGEFTPRNLTTIDDRANEVFAARVGLLEGQNELRAGMVAFIHVKK